MILAEQDGYSLITLDQEEIQQAHEAMARSLAINRDYLASLASRPKGGRLTGSFIYAHPPDYVGQPTMHWGVRDWRGLFQQLKELGIDTVIYQAAAWVEMRECYYRSKIFSAYRSWNSLEPLTEAVAAEGLTLFLGGLGNLLAFDEKTTAGTLAGDRDMQLACVRELQALYRGGFHGFYMSPETGFPGQRQPAREALLNTYYCEVCRGVKELMPGLPILFSPATFYRENCAEETHDYLFNLFKGCPFDVMCPQDSIGALGNQLPYLDLTFAIWRQICQELGVALWVNVESFERARGGTTQDFVAADFERLAVQLSYASRAGQKIVSWEVPYFYSPLAGERGLKLRRDYLASLAAGERE